MSNLVYSEAQKAFWQRRFSDKPDDAIQTTKVSSMLRSHISARETYTSGLDLGCGNGRFVPLLSAICQHLWAVDILPDVTPHVQRRARNVTPWILNSSSDSLPDGPHDLLFVSFVFQHITEDGVFKGLTTELKRVLAPGARVFILDNARDKAPHIKPREPGMVACALGLKKWDSQLVNINNRPADHWWLEGVK